MIQEKLKIKKSHVAPNRIIANRMDICSFDICTHRAE